MKKSDLIVLVVDDDPAFRTAMGEAIKRFGYKSLLVAKAEEALNAVKIKQYQVALIDCMLPRMNGVDLASEMRKSRFGHHPIILMSGVFKDRAFANEAIEKTKAIDFLLKPFELSQLQVQLEKAVAPFISPSQIPLHVLVSKPFTSSRERTKVIEGLEEVIGYDLPFILCVLIDAKSTGYLNITNEEGEIFGISIQDGTIIGVDSGEKEATILMLLVEKGFLSREDLASFRQSQRRGDIVQSLIDTQHVSPHVLPIVTKEQMQSDLSRLFSGEKFNINFVPERKKKEVFFGCTLEDLTPLLHEVVQSVVPVDYLVKFYKDWMDHPIQLGSTFQNEQSIFELNIYKYLVGLPQLLNKNLTIEEVKTQGKFDQGNLLRGLHLLTFLKLIVFDDVKKAKSVAEYGERIRQMLKELHGKNPFEVFAYFGVSEGAREQEVERVYREFARANHPDLLSPGSSPELKKMVNQLFSIVSDANETLTRPEKRSKLVQELKQQQAEAQIQAEALADDAILHLRRGQVKEALAKTKQAFDLCPVRNVKVAYAWTLLKSKPTGDVTAEVNQILESIPHEERRTAHYAYVLGLLKKNLGDLAGAKNQFEKAMALDPQFLDARRERSAISGESEKVDLFKSDLGQLVGNFFKKKK